MKEYRVRDLMPGSVFEAPLFLENGSSPEGAGGFIVCPAALPFTQEMRTMLFEWDWPLVYSGGGVEELRKPGSPRGEETPSAPEVPEDAVPRAGQTRQEKGIDTLNTAERLALAGEIYKRLLDFAADLFTRAAGSVSLSWTDCAERMWAFVKFIGADPVFVLYAVENAKPLPAGNFLSEHGARTAAIALVIAAQVKMPPEEMTELGLAALLHEIELIRIPARIHGGGELSAEDRKLLAAHPLLGSRRLAAFHFPEPVCRAALEHHERMDHSGYPRHLGGGKISVYGKILALSCACAEIQSQGQGRKDIHAATEKLLAEQGGKFDDTVVRALLYAMRGPGRTRPGAG